MVSVVIGVYNGAQHLEETVASILSQQGCEFELVVVDDGSTDASPQILAALAARDVRVRVLTQPNAGLTRALVRGCESARGEFIARQDVGDVSLPQRLALQASVLQASPGIGFVSCAHRFLGPAGEPLTSLAQSPNTVAPGQIPNPHHGSVMFRKSTYLQAGGYRPDFYFAQDVDLWSRLIEHSGFATCPEVLYEVRFDLDGITARHRASQQALRALIDETAQARRNGASGRKRTFAWCLSTDWRSPFDAIPQLSGFPLVVYANPSLSPVSDRSDRSVDRLVERRRLGVRQPRRSARTAPAHRN